MSSVIEAAKPKMPLMIATSRVIRMCSAINTAKSMFSRLRRPGAPAFQKITFQMTTIRSEIPVATP